MRTDWYKVKVEDIAADSKFALATGPFGSSISSKFFVSSGVPVIRGSNLSQEIGARLLDDGLAFLTDEKAAEFERSEVRKGDLIFTCWGTIDQVGLIDKRAKFDRYIVSNKQMKFTPHPDKADSLYLYYYFSSPKLRDTILSCGIGSSVPGFNLGQLKGMQVLLPPLHTQRGIAKVLGSLDDKIELNRRTNDTLEEMARAIFKSWFVDFDPVRAKMDGRQPVGMDAETAGLFPSEFEDSKLGKIPKGWSVNSLERVIEILSGGTPQTSVEDYWDGDILWFSVKDAPRESDVFVIETEKKITQLGLDNSAAKLLPARATIISARGTVGKLAMTAGLMTMNQSCYGVRPAKGFGDFFTYYNLKAATGSLQRSAHGSVFDTITRKTFEILEVVIPPTELTNLFDALVEPLMEKILYNLRENGTLRGLRDSLLPKLLSGEIRALSPATECFEDVSDQERCLSL